MSLNQDESVRIAICQIDVKRGDVRHNADKMLWWLEHAAKAGARLVIFPECALNGYMFHSKEEAAQNAVSLSHPVILDLAAAVRALGVYLLFGLLETAESGENSLYNSALLMGPDGIIGRYRKTHLPILGVDRYVTAGDSLPIFTLPFARIGILICYDLRFPEAARTLALHGADILIVPTNWPEGAESSPEFITRARAWENRVFLAACNRVGIEEGAKFIGNSQMVTPGGIITAQADGESETMLTADIFPVQARNKRVIIRPGEFEMDPIGGRRPELYLIKLEDGN